MSKPHPERPSPPGPAARATPLPTGIRHHLGRNLRAYYAEALAAPVTQRLEALIAQLTKPKA